MSKIVLITGCSTGIGRDLAERLTRSGYTVIATARNVESLESSNPKARYVAGFPFSGRIFLHLGDSVWNFTVKQMFKAA